MSRTLSDVTPQPRCRGDYNSQCSHAGVMWYGNLRAQHAARFCAGDNLTRHVCSTVECRDLRSKKVARLVDKGETSTLFGCDLGSNVKSWGPMSTDNTFAARSSGIDATELSGVFAQVGPPCLTADNLD